MRFAADEELQLHLLSLNHPIRPICSANWLPNSSQPSTITHLYLYSSLPYLHLYYQHPSSPNNTLRGLTKEPKKKRENINKSPKTVSPASTNTAQQKGQGDPMITSSGTSALPKLSAPSDPLWKKKKEESGRKQQQCWLTDGNSWASRRTA